MVRKNVASGFLFKPPAVDARIVRHLGLGNMRKTSLRRVEIHRDQSTNFHADESRGTESRATDDDHLRFILRWN
ncbi:hypothetical protein [Sporisorium scitamineum]|uniref:Uncharacterized protein n=1 Tax=Sporisorium scitamineum TaxID=49012 RepID=A0A0F7RZY4_9BASI|nr:hypothetical protein [Sporisorium scitamineum]